MPRPRLVAALAAGFLLLALPSLARVEVPADAGAGPGGVPPGPQAAECRCGGTVPLLLLGLPGLAEAEFLARWTAPGRALAEAERTRFRALRLRPLRGPLPVALRRAPRR
ncbi:hypothetical protein [Paracraurococcus ruber]|uniref:Uncharacterized protein n=1 Tax=Paracraurococcus ruber TaxID=77675 RepID=A0ABS1D418_9PROT|nr:hypothetical protein [Paracraurococcus ruber]MBK1661539.1 hypothetical protein [Paracraurococcus ruber]TDG19049.1 hypothetical protein E2C05_27755 [Paracraurococcus ruber]